MDRPRTLRCTSQFFDIKTLQEKFNILCPKTLKVIVPGFLNIFGIVKSGAEKRTGDTSSGFSKISSLLQVHQEEMKRLEKFGQSVFLVLSLS